MPDPTIHPIVTVLDTFITVGAVDTLVLVANANRQELDLVNDSVEPIYIARGGAAVMNSGLRLNPRGGAYRMGTDNLYHGEIRAICESGDMNLCVSEGS